MPSYPAAIPTFSTALQTIRAVVVNSNVMKSMASVCWSPELGIFCAVGRGSTGLDAATSPDGYNWTARNTPVISGGTSQWNNVIWSPELRLFCACGENSVATNTSRVMTSPDGITWTLRNTSIATVWQEIEWSPKTGLFVIVESYTTGAPQINTSPDGINWTARSTPTTAALGAVCWSPQLGIYCAVRVSASGFRVVTSPDGINWTVQTTPGGADNNWTDVCWSPELGLFAAVASTGTNRIMTSSDGVTWLTYAAPAVLNWMSVAWSPQKRAFFAVAYNNVSMANEGLMTSTNGTTWTTVPCPEPLRLWSTCWSPELGIFASVSLYSGAGKVLLGVSDAIQVTDQNNQNDEIVAIEAELGVNLTTIQDAVAVSSTPASVAAYLDMVAAILKNMTAVNHWESSGLALSLASRGLCWSPEMGMFVIVGDTVTTTSIDGKNWTYSNGSLTTPRGVAWSPELHRFVTLSNTTANRYYSDDGVNWNTGAGGTAPLVKGWVGICWSSEKMMFAAVAESGTGNRVATSTDGISWDARVSPADNNWKSVCYSPQLHMFVAVASSGSGNRVMTSTDGVTWSLQSSAADNNWTSVCWSPELGLFVAVAESGSGNRVMTSINGTGWTIRTSAADNNWQSVAWAPEIGMFMAVANSGSGNRSMYSFDGINWTTMNTTADQAWISITWSSKLMMFCAVCTSGVEVGMTIDWSHRWSNAAGLGSGLVGELTQTIGTIQDGIWNGIAWSPSLGLFAAVTQGGVSLQRAATSTDGITWTMQTTPNDNAWQSICWSPSLGLFVAVAASGTGNRVMTSSNGTAWAAQTTPADITWQSVCWSPALTLFVAVASFGAGNRVMTSSNGTVWTLRASADDTLPWSSVCWSAALGMFVAVQNSGGTSTTRVMTSTNGTAWTARSAPIGYWNCVEWSPELGLFVALSYDQNQYSVIGKGARAMTSTNGIDWTLRTEGLKVYSAQRWRSIVWSSELRMFVACAERGNRYISVEVPDVVFNLMYSTDGINWTPLVSAPFTYYLSMAWSPTLMKFCAIGNRSDVVSAATKKATVTLQWLHNSYNPPVPARSMLGGHGALSTVAASGTMYAYIFEYGLNATEANAKYIMPYKCRLNIRTFKVFLNGTTPGSPGNSGLRFTIKKNGVSTGVSTEIPGGSTVGINYPFYNYYDQYVNFDPNDVFTLEVFNGNVSIASAPIASWSIEVDQIG